MLRKSILLAVLVCALIALFARFAQTANPQLDADTIRAALRTTAIEENGFVDNVVAKMKAKTLPRSMVESTFNWARKKNKNRFQYFKQALITRAADIGVQL
jgi:hypothetical protein